MVKAVVALAVLFVAMDGIAAVAVTYDHASGTLSCDGASKVEGACIVSLHEGDVVVIQVKNSVPGLFDMAVQKTDKAPEVAPQAFATAAGLSRAQPQPSTPAPTTSSQMSVDEFIQSGGTSVTDVYNSFVQALALLEHSLRVNVSEYPGAVRDVRRARVALLAAIQPTADDPLAVSKAVLAGLKKEKSIVAVTERDLSDVWTKLDNFLRAAPSGLGDLAPQTFRYEDRDFDLAVDIKPNFDLFSIPTRHFVLPVQLAGAWTLRSTSGIALSGLYDEHYTKRTFIDTPATGTTPAVTHEEVVRERRDAAYPEATLFLHIARQGRHDALSLGAGIATGNAAARLYLGYSHKLALAAAWSVGIAGGNVKRLSNGIDVKHPGTADPEQTRHDVFKFAPFVCVSVRLGGSPQ
jgi:hypothetical protein